MKPTTSLSCRELIDFIAAYLDDELSADDNARFEAHIARCPYCVDYLASYRESIRLGRRALDPDGAIPEEVPEELVQAVLGSRKR